MQCQTLRPGTECFFWKKSGCTHKDNLCHELVTECQGCANTFTVDDKAYCSKFPEPLLKWLTGPCMMATHLAKDEKKADDKKVNPLKASKRMAKGGKGK